MSALWTSLEMLTAPIRWVDAKIQAGVNAGMFALMRRGLAKSTIRYGLWAIAIVALILSTAIDIEVKARSLVDRSITIFFLCLIPIIQHIERHEDAAVEAGKAVKVRPDADMAFRVIWLWLLTVDILKAGGVIAVIKELAAHPQLARQNLWIQLVIDVAILLVFYTRRTPPKAPDKAPKPVLVPARSEA